MPTLYERYNTVADGDGTYLVYGDNQISQSFKCGIDNDITSFKFYLIRVGACTGLNIIMALQEADPVTGKPSGSDLITVSIDATTIDTALEWVEFTLAASRSAGATKYCVILRLDGGDGSNYIGVRYDGSSPLYSDADLSVVYTTDAAVTWIIDADKDILFEQWGEAAELPSTVEELVLMPGGVGDYTELHASKAGFNNYQMVDDAAEAPDDKGSRVYVDFDHVLTGIVTWGNDSQTLAGVDTFFTSELAEDYYIRRGESTVDPDGVLHNLFPSNICKISSITTDLLATLAWSHVVPTGSYPYWMHGDWFLHGSYANERPITGQMMWSDGKNIQYGIGTLFLTELVVGGRIRNANVGGSGYYVGQIDDNLTVHMALRDGDLHNPYSEGIPGEDIQDIEFAPEGEDTEDTTQYTAPEKKDSYILKQTRTHGTIYGVKVVFRINPSVWSSSSQEIDSEILSSLKDTAAVHATPFLRYGGVNLWGDEIEMTPELEAVSEGSSVYQAVDQWTTYEWEAPGAPGGGDWDWDIISALQVGIQLDMVVEGKLDILNRMDCTQIYVVVTHDPPAQPDPDPTPIPDPEPDPDPPAPPKPPPVPPPFVCNDGDTMCIGTTLHTCLNNRYRFTEVRSEACGYEPPPDPVPSVFYKGVSEFGRSVHNGLDEFGHMADDDMNESGQVIREHFTT